MAHLLYLFGYQICIIQISGNLLIIDKYLVFLKLIRETPVQQLKLIAYR